MDISGPVVAKRVGQAKTSQGPAPLQQDLSNSCMLSSQNEQGYDIIKDLCRKIGLPRSIPQVYPGI